MECGWCREGLVGGPAERLGYHAACAHAYRAELRERASEARRLAKEVRARAEELIKASAPFRSKSSKSSE
jgi:hypothetical protein